MTITVMQGYMRDTKLSSNEKQEKIPAIFYGKQIKKNIMLYVLRKEFMNFFNNVATRDCYATIFKIVIENKEYTAIVKDIQWEKNSIVPFPLHLDFFEIGSLTSIKTKMYINFKNKDKCVGVKNGGKLQIFMKECLITANPHKMPSSLEVDLLSLDIGGKILVESLENKYEYCNLHIIPRNKIAIVVGKK